MSFLLEKSCPVYDTRAYKNPLRSTRTRKTRLIQHHRSLFLGRRLCGRMFLWSLCVFSLLHTSFTCTVPDNVCTTNQAVKDEIVNAHNEFRRDVHPPASDMLKMSWNSKVAESAQKWVDKCNMTHGPVSSRLLGSYEMGENLLKAEKFISWTDVVTAWHNEVFNYEYPVGSINGKAIGHYTQVIWFSSYQVGCGVAQCGLYYFYDCQYYRAGNYRRVAPYTVGEPCSDCPQACDDKLCTDPCPYVNEYANCDELVNRDGCTGSLVRYCAAKCFCPTDIIPTN